MDVRGYWQAVLAQNEGEIRRFFHPDAEIRWHNSNEHFNVDEFVRANCEYPGEWTGVVERVETMGDRVIAVTQVRTMDGSLSFHAVSFIKVREGKIAFIDEYWGDDGQAPQWRLDKKIGQPIA